MPTPTYTPLANLTLGSSAASVTFSSISQAYRDLVIVADNIGCTTDAPPMSINYNNDVGSNYNVVTASGLAANTANSGQVANNTFLYATYYAGLATTRKTQIVLNIFDYSATDKHKSSLSRMGHSDLAEVNMMAGRWANTAAITTIKLWPNSGSFTSGSTFALYGIAA